ncbi:hypothetical protein SAMN05444365_103210 [Micromonospora pattaloongensis]|uniref:Uncharacterized protein n=1 Tax=Micromonospora pattaloongensis TaxID=405436 RepID=A0A1H3M353_9ACTN|nr:hypothetical protein [Micromonospora pattaloongensis]SDY71013.1 hypothetical protein SAMN05444365_103210 [Micromonospora pattaloongensis]
MDHPAPSATLPLRPLTVGELLDTAVSLLRAYGRTLVPIGALLAAVEQLALAPLRLALGGDPPAYLPELHRLGGFWLLLCVGAATETAIIALLGGLAARAAGAELLGQRLRPGQLCHPRGGRFGAVLIIAVVAGVTVFAVSLAGPLWMAGYALLGLAIPALVLDRVGPVRAVRRGAALACRAGLRAAGVRILGYLAWLALRLALGFAGFSALDAVGLVDPRWAPLAAAVTWLLVNAIAYPTLACLDAVLHLETRMRTEGLDILLSRARHHGPLTPALLAARP